MPEERLDSWRIKLIGAGAACLLLCLVLGCATDPQQFFHSYLFAFMFWFALAIGCLGILMLSHVVGGQWAHLVRPLLEAGAMTLPWLAVLFIPILFGLIHIYSWADPRVVAADPLLQHKALYLDPWFFRLRAAGGFALWSFLAIRLGAWSREQRRTQDAELARKAERFCAPGLVVYVLTLTFTTLDWMMSLEPHWYSTIYEVMIMIGQLLGAFAFTLCAAAVLFDPAASSEEAARKPFLDLGNLLLTFVVLWAYMGFSQYLIIWSGNIPDEISWYLHRQSGGWFALAMGLIAFQFFLPFLVLLGRRNKQTLSRLAAVAALILGVRAADLFWLIAPAFHPAGFRLSWWDAALPISLGLFWLGGYLTQLQRQLPSGALVWKGAPLE